MALNPLVQRFLESVQKQTLPTRAATGLDKTPTSLDPVTTRALGAVRGASPSGAPTGGTSSGIGGVVSQGWKPSTGKGWDGLNPKVKEWVQKTLAQWGGKGVTFSSGYRDPAYNASIGGVPNSGHTRGWKADFSGDERVLRQVADWLDDWGAKVLIHGKENGDHRNHLDVSWEAMYSNR